MRFTAIAVTLGLVAVAAGCGGSGSATKTVVPPTTTAAARTTTEAMTASTTTEAMTTSTTAGSGGGSKLTFASTKNCAQLESIGRKFAAALSAQNATGTSSLANVSDVFKAMADAAPAEIRPDFQTIAKAFANYAETLKKAGFKPGQAPTPATIAKLASVAKTFSDPKLQAAEQRLSAWGTKNCHFKAGG